MQKVVKQNCKIQSIDNANKDENKKAIYKFKVSDNKINRNGWRILTDGIDTKNFKDNPVVLLNHDNNKIIGKVNKIEKVNNEMFMYMEFHEITEDSKVTKQLLDSGYMNMSSISILPIKTKYEKKPPNYKGYIPGWMEEVTVFEKSTLLEISVVTIPASPTAKLKEVIAASYNNDAQVLSYIDNYVEEKTEIKSEYIINNQKGDTMELAVENAKLQKDVEILQKEISAKEKLFETKENELNDILEKNNNTIVELQTVKTELEKVNADLTKTKEERENISKQQKENEIDVFLAKYKDRIKPSELELIKEELVVLKDNPAMKVGDKTLYEIKINEIEKRKSLELETRFDNGVEPKKLDILNFESDDSEDIAKIDKAVKDYAQENKVSYTESFEILRKQNESEE